MNDLVQTLETLLGQDDVESLVKILDVFFQRYLNDFNTDYLIAKGNYTNVKKSYYNNEISLAEYQQGMAKTRHAFAMLIDNIKTGAFDTTDMKKVVDEVLSQKSAIPKPLKKNKSLVYGSVGLGALVVLFAVYQLMDSKPVAKKPVLTAADFDKYYFRAWNLRHAVGQDNYKTADGQAKVRQVKLLLDTTLMITPDSAKVWNDRADCFMILGELDSAMASVQKSLSIDAYYATTYATRAQVKALRGDVEGFYKDAEEAMNRGLNVWHLRKSLGFEDYQYEDRFIDLAKKYKQYD